MLKVGEPYPNLKAPAPDSSIFSVTDAGLELILIYSNPSPAETQAIRTGQADFALMYKEDLIWFLYQLEPLPWSEAVFTQHLVPADRRQAPSHLEGDQRLLLNIILIDGDTSIIKALRAITLTPELSWTLRDMYNRQAQTPPITPNEYEQRTRTIQSIYTTEELLEFAENRA